MPDKTSENWEDSASRTTVILAIVARLETLEDSIEKYSNEWQQELLEIRAALKKLGD